MTSLGMPRAVEPRRASPVKQATIHRVLLVCGVLVPLVYIAMDVIAAAQYPGYSMRDQAISELSAIGSPTREFWSMLSPLFEVLLLAFSIGVLWVSGANRALRISGALLLAFGVSGVLWWFAPMHERGAQMTWTDVMHIALGAASIVFMLLFIGFGASAFGRGFRRYSWASMLAVVVGGGLTFASAGRMVAQEPTPWLGVVERIMIYGYLLWIGVLAVMLVRHDGRGRGGVPRTS